MNRYNFNSVIVLPPFTKGADSSCKNLLLANLSLLVNPLVEGLIELRQLNGLSAGLLF